VLVRHIDVPVADTVLVAAPASTRPALVALARKNPGTELTDPRAAWAPTAESSDAGTMRVALALILAFTAIALVNTLAMSVVDRRREFALLRLIGMTRHQLLRMLRTETLIASAIGITAGGAIGTGTLIAFTSGMTDSVVPAIDPAQCTAVAVGAILLTSLATLITARLVVRAEPRAVPRI
jgi:putative ABC transport system permease protein